MSTMKTASLDIQDFTSEIQAHQTALVGQLSYDVGEMKSLQKHGFSKNGPRLPSGSMHRIDDIRTISFGGSHEHPMLIDYVGWALGRVSIDKDHPIFMEHFKGDPVLPGSYMTEGLSQMLGFYLSWLEVQSNIVKNEQWIDYPRVPRLNSDGCGAFSQEVPPSVEYLYYLVRVRKIEDQTGGIKGARYLKAVADGTTFYRKGDRMCKCVATENLSLSIFNRSFLQKLLCRAQSGDEELTKFVESINSSKQLPL